MRIVTDDGVGLEVEQSRRPGPPLADGARVHRAPRRTSPTTSTRSPSALDGRAPSTTAVTARATSPTTAAAYSLDRLAADTLAVADALGFDRFRAPRALDGRDGRPAASCSPQPERVEALVLMDTSPGRRPGIDPRPRRRRRRRSRSTRAWPCCAQVLDELDPLGHAGRPARAARAAGLRGVRRRASGRASPRRCAYAALVREIVRPARPARRARGRSRCPTLVDRRRAGRAVPRRLSHAMADAIPSAELVVDPRRRSLAAVREPRRVPSPRSTRFLHAIEPRWRVVSRARRAAARGGDAAGARRRHRLHAERWAPLPALRRVREARHPARRHPPRADRGVRGRGLGEGHPPRRRRRAHRRPRRHQRRQRDHERVPERIAGARDRRARAAGALGLGLAPGARPRADRRVDHEARGDAPRRRRRSRPGSTPRCGPPARRTAARRSSTSRSTGGAGTDAPGAAAPDAAALAGAAPDPATRSRASRRSSARRRGRC